MTEPTYWTELEDPWFLYRLIGTRGWYSNAKTRGWVEDASIYGQVERRGGESLDQVSRSRAGEIAKQLKIVLDHLDPRSPRKDSYRFLIEKMQTEPRYFTELDRPTFLYRLIGVRGWMATARTGSWEADFEDGWVGDTVCGMVDGMAGNFYDMISQPKALQIAKRLGIVLDRLDSPPKRKAAR